MLLIYGEKLKRVDFLNIINTQLIFIHGIAIMRAVRYQPQRVSVSAFRCTIFFGKTGLNPPHYLNEDGAQEIFQHEQKMKEKEKKVGKLSILIKMYVSTSSGT